MKIFRERLKIAMGTKAITQSDLCKLTGIPKSAMSQYLSGEFQPKDDRAEIIAKALNVSVARLMGYSAFRDENCRYESEVKRVSKFNTRLKELRYRDNITQQELADKLGISKSSVNMYERDEREPGLDLLEKKADFFDVSVDNLLGRSASVGITSALTNVTTAALIEELKHRNSAETQITKPQSDFEIKINGSATVFVITEK